MEQQKDLSWWMTSLGRANGQDILPTRPQVQVTSDASKTGWGLMPWKEDKGERGDPIAYQCTRARGSSVFRIWEWCLERSITLTAEYLPGKENLVADYESGHMQMQATGCSSPASSRLSHTSGDPSISTCLQQGTIPSSHASSAGLTALGVNAMLQDWHPWKPYLFPHLC